jgi:hypothetical protein
MDQILSERPSKCARGQKSVKIPLWRNQHELSEYVALVDAADVPIIETVRWYLHDVRGSRTHYARGLWKGQLVLMHILILGEPDDELETDHENGNGLDNRRRNLRRFTHAQNIHAARDRDTLNRRHWRPGPGVNAVRATLKSTGETVRYYYHTATRTRLPEYPGHPDYEKALATIVPNNAQPRCGPTLKKR